MWKKPNWMKQKVKVGICGGCNYTASVGEWMISHTTGWTVDPYMGDMPTGYKCPCCGSVGNPKWEDRLV